MAGRSFSTGDLYLDFDLGPENHVVDGVELPVSLCEPRAYNSYGQIAYY